MAGNSVVIDVQALEDDLVERAAEAGACVGVEALRVAQQVEGSQEEAPPDVDLAGSVCKLVQDFATFTVDGGELLLELGLGPVGVAHEVEVLVFLGVQLLQASSEPLAQGVHAAQLVDEGVVELAAYTLLELIGEADGGVVPYDLPLYLLDGQVRLIANALLPSDAEEVEVGAAVAFGALDDEAPLAAGTPDRALEVVVVLAFAGAAAVPQGEDTLYAIEQLGRDNGRVATFVLFVFVGDDALVVRVLKHLVEGVQGDWLFGFALGGAGGQSGGCDDLVHLLPGVVASGVQLEGFEHERGALLVEGDGADFAAVDLLADVEVADFGLGDGAAVLGFLAHLVGDVGTAGL